MHQIAERGSYKAAVGACPQANFFGVQPDSLAGQAPCMLPRKILIGFHTVTGEAVRSWKQRGLTSSVERLPASLLTPKGIPKPTKGLRIHKVGSGKQCEVGEPVPIVSNQ